MAEIAKPNSDANRSPADIAAVISTMRVVVTELSATIAMLERYVPETTADSPCTACQRYPNCGDKCEALEKRLPRPYAGQTHGESIARGLIDDLPISKFDRRANIFESYSKCQKVFTDKQWAVICLYYGEGKTRKQIEEILGIKHSALGGLRKRAQDRKDKYDKKLRQEQLKFIRELNK